MIRILTILSAVITLLTRWFSTHKSGLKITSTWELKDPDGKVVLREESNSWLDAFGVILCAILDGTEKNVKETDGSTDGWLMGYSQYAIKSVASIAAGSGSSTYGLVAGLGDTAVEHDDYELEDLIPHGTGTDELQYGEVTTNDPSYVGGTITIVNSRPVTNASGAGITVKEVGAIAYHAGNASYGDTSGGYALIDRHVLGTPVLIGDTTTFTLTWTISITSA